MSEEALVFTDLASYIEESRNNDDAGTNRVVAGNYVIDWSNVVEKYHKG